MSFDLLNHLVFSNCSFRSWFTLPGIQHTPILRAKSSAVKKSKVFTFSLATTLDFLNTLNSYQYLELIFINPFYVISQTTALLSRKSLHNTGACILTPLIKTYTLCIFETHTHTHIEMVKSKQICSKSLFLYLALGKLFNFIMIAFSKVTCWW